jgi:hypothetical protein
MKQQDARTLGIKAVEALPEGVHKIRPRLYLKRDDRPTGTRRSVLVRWQQNGRPDLKSLGPWQAALYGRLLARAERVGRALQEGRDPRVVLDEQAGPGTFKEAAESYMALNLDPRKDEPTSASGRRGCAGSTRRLATFASRNWRSPISSLSWNTTGCGFPSRRNAPVDALKP